MALAASLPVGMAQSGHTQAFVGTGLPGQSSAQIPHGLDAVSNMVSDVASQRKSGIERSESVTSSSSRSTEILNHLLDLKQQAGQANTAVNPHDIQVRMVLWVVSRFPCRARSHPEMSRYQIRGHHVGLSGTHAEVLWQAKTCNPGSWPTVECL